MREDGGPLKGILVDREYPVDREPETSDRINTERPDGLEREATESVVKDP